MRCRDQIVPLVASLCILAGWSSAGRAADPVDLSGTWHGHWVSCRTGHKGTLHACFCKLSDNCYRVRFSGTFFVAVPFVFTVPLEVTEVHEGHVVLSGAPRLPLFGTFHFHAVATDSTFTATYRSRNDEGRFVLCR